jgi:hypothetical protein
MHLKIKGAYAPICQNMTLVTYYLHLTKKKHQLITCNLILFIRTFQK